MGRWLLENFLPWIVAPLYFLFSKTWRLRITGDPEVLKRFVNAPSAAREPVVYAHWHGDELVLLPFYAFRKLAVLSSLSKDGTIMANVLRVLGYQVFRGSSSRGGARGLLALIQKVKAGFQASLAVDGPKGPIYEVKPGIVELALRSHKPIVVVRVFATQVWRIPKAWNRSYVPKPFSRVEVQFTRAIELPEKDLPANKLDRQIVVDSVASDIKIALDGAQPRAITEPPALSNI